MFERYTEKARRIIFFARYEASQFGSSTIEPEHLLLGLFREAREIIAGLGVPENLERELRDAMQPAGKKISVSVDLPLSHTAKRVLAYGAEEAEILNHKHIAPEHLLLALLRENTPAESILRKGGVTAPPIRERIRMEGTTLSVSREELSGRNRNRAIVDALRQTFAPMASRLAPEIEPAVTFSLRPGAAE
jgi:ATP-dependent Clp protease ATP-binding subunit ClpC